MNAAADYLALTKPRILPLVLFSGLPALVMAAGAWPAAEVAIATLLGTACCAGAANALNGYLERDRDARMQRTRLRPLPAGRLSPRRALTFGLALAVSGVALLWARVGLAPALIAVAAIGVYVFAYTLWLKPRTPFAVVVGGVSGAIAPLIADAAIDGQVGAAGWMLFAIIFVWQPPHFYAIALLHRADYARAGFPMLPDRIGLRRTCRRILLWLAVLLPLTLAPVMLLPLGWVYGLSAGLLGLALVQRALRLRAQPGEEAARGVFRMSLVHLIGLFAAMIADLAASLAVG